MIIFIYKYCLQGIRRKSSIQDTCSVQTNINSIFANLMQVVKGIILNVEQIFLTFRMLREETQSHQRVLQQTFTPVINQLLIINNSSVKSNLI